MIRASLAPMMRGDTSGIATCCRGNSGAARHGALVGGVGEQPVQRFWRTGLAVAMLAWLAVVGVACSKAHEVPAQIEWPDASTLAPARSIDPTASQTPPTEDADGDQGQPPAGPDGPVKKEAAAEPQPSPSR